MVVTTISLRYDTENSVGEIETEEDGNILLEDIKQYNRFAITLKYRSKSGNYKLLKVRVSLFLVVIFM